MPLSGKITKSKLERGPLPDLHDECTKNGPALGHPWPVLQSTGASPVVAQPLRQAGGNNKKGP